MSFYLASLVIGGVGLVLMAAAGLGHHGHSGGSHGAHHGALHHGSGHGHGHAGHAHSGSQSHSAWSGASVLWALASPRILFSLLVGFGAAGFFLQRIASAPWTFVGALAGAIVLERLVVRSVWNLVSRFESRPALTLESCLDDEVKAVTSFDASGQGLVQLEVDGQVVQILAMLGEQDRARGVRVGAGARLRVDDVDSARNRCTVSYIGAALTDGGA